ncbi:double-stranded RNA-specific adenosine deaminase [Gadus morhua]|uniref:Adenosine deaminase RNA specific n=1 Tax=Gadus morhua TaxID=8049 RepID=A0A8C5FB32_GADMO|nr:double-stranded RNA-specific adenosine deaminase [Gadus morhua]XP_030225897.1 double-stranded RNA-specific adenosine deaminase [Gadus morhua]
MSRGRGGPSKEQYSRPLTAHLKAKQYSSSTDPSTPHPRVPPPLQVPRTNDFSCSGYPVGPFGSPEHSRFSLTPTVPYNNQVSSVKVGDPTASFNQNLRPRPEPNSFLYLQAKFLRGQSSEAPQFRGSPRQQGWTPNNRASFAPHQPVYGRYPRSSPRGRGNNRWNQGFANSSVDGATRTPSVSQYWNHNQTHTATYSQHSNRHWGTQSDSLAEGFQDLSLHNDRSNTSLCSFDSTSPSGTSISNSCSKVNLTVTSDIQELLLSALAALSPSESIAARPLAKRLKLPKKIVNSVLYSLEGLGKAFKKGTTPPLWSLYRELGGALVLVNDKRGGHLAQQWNCSERSLQPTIQLEQNVETIEALEEPEERCSVREDCSDAESTSSCCSSFESSDSDHNNTPTVSSSLQEVHPPAMANQKDQIFRYLLQNPDASALVIAKNVGLKTAQQIHSTLHNMEKQGELKKNSGVNPPTWELSNRRREKMERSLKASQCAPPAEQLMEVGDAAGKGATTAMLLPPPAQGLEPSPLQESWQPLQGMKEEAGRLAIGSAGFPSAEDQSMGRPPDVVVKPDPEQERPPAPAAATPFHPREDEANGEQWATDEIPEFLNAIRRQTDAHKRTGDGADNMGTVAVSLAAPPPQNQWAKLQEVRLKNPVSGLMEYAQYLGQSCEFVLLDQSGPSHDPRFRMQVILDGRSFPVAEASSKKVAKKDAAAATLRSLIGEGQGGACTGEDRTPAPLDQVMDPVPDTTAPVGGMDEAFGTVGEEGTGLVEGPRQPLSRSLPGGKNPVSVLMEFSQRTGSSIEFINTGQEGPPHDPRFMYRVKVGEGLCAEASAPSKKAARQLAAEEAVKELMADGRLQLNKPQLPLGSGDSEEGGSGSTCPSLPPLTADELRAAHEAGVGDLINHLNNNAVSGLLEYARARGFAAEIRLVGQTGPPHEPKFTYQAKLGGRWFPPVCASNKKQGKQEAADAALRVLIGEAERAARTGELIPAELPVSGSTLHDQIAMLSHQRFNALTTRIQHSLLGRKILATIVMRRGEGLGTVVSLGTGNRCVKGEELSLKGDTVNDCHAEIISRRGFLRFLYSELLKYHEGDEGSIFEAAEENRLRVKSDITFHLYISTAPCGDGALFDKSCSETGDEVEGHHPLFENSKQGKLRTKVENGEGTIPVESSAIVPTWDGIQHGERLRTMSCSDKILRWNVVGLQGALLSHFLHPIYLKSITLGYLYSHGHLTRAVCCRLARDGEGFSKSLPSPFRLNHPEVGRVSVYDSTRHTGKTKESSVNWSFPDQLSVEVLDGTKGILDGPRDDVSRVSKSNLFRQFRLVCELCGRQDLLALPSYSQAKVSALTFQLAKQNFFQALHVHGYGAWIGKPLEEKSFESAESVFILGGGGPAVVYGGTTSTTTSTNNSSSISSNNNGGMCEIKPEQA